jgi:mRNA interferase MazF
MIQSKERVKDFDNWNKLKKEIHFRERKFYVKPREVVWLSLGENVGDEENGKGNGFQRPVLVLKVFNKNIFYGVPLSSKLKENNIYYLKVMLTERNKITNELVTLERSVLASHAKLFDTKRIVEHMGYLKQEDFRHIIPNRT